MQMNNHNQFYNNNNYDSTQRMVYMNDEMNNNNNNTNIQNNVPPYRNTRYYHPHHQYHYMQNYHQDIEGKNNLVPLDGIQSGVPTRTTPTLTPTTLRNIEQTLLEWSNDVDRPVSTPCQAGFVPPLAPGHYIDSNDNNSIGSSESGSQNSWHTPIMHEENSLALTDTSSVATIYTSSNHSPSLPTATSTGSVATTMPQSTIGSLSTTTSTNNQNKSNNTTRRNTGGRRPNKPTNLTPEEEEKRKIRRERNKLAAARCRKRRVDQTNELIEKVDQLEKEKQGLQQKIEELKSAAEELEMCLQSHQPSCKLLSTSSQNRLSPCDMKPVVLSAATNSLIGATDVDDDTGYAIVKSIKTEPLEQIVDSLDAPPSPKRIMLTSNNPVVPPLPTVSTIASTIAAATSILNTPTITTPPISIASTIPLAAPATSTATSKPNRPSSLNVPLTITPSQALGLTKTVTDITGVPITTPSSGVTFNFDSLMDGGTGLTPVAAPLMPTCSSQNKHPLELITPTSESSKLVSL